MTFVQLETFYWIVQLGGFSVAARRLNASQPAISARIRQLEASLGGKLFDRGQKGVQLTARGQTLFEEATALVDHVARIQSTLSTAATVGGTLRLGIAELVAVTWLPQLVSRINEAYPKIRVELDVDLTLVLLEKLRSGRLDMVILPGPISDSSFARRSVGRARFEWMASPRFELPRRCFRPSDLTRWPIMTLSNQSNLHRVLEDWFAEEDVELKRADVCNSLTVLTELVAAGIGLGYLSVLQTQRMVETGALEILEVSPPIAELEYYAAYPRRSMLSLGPKIADLAAQVSTFQFLERG